MGEAALYRDPTLDAAAWLEAEEKKCAVCQRRMVFVMTDDVQCSEGKRWPRCLSDKKKGFKLEDA